MTARRSPDANAERGGNPIHTADRGTVMARRWGPIRRPYTTSIVLVLLGVLVALEMLLRLRGRAAWHVPSVPSTEPAMVEYDSTLGWRNKPGTYVYAGYSLDAPDITVTIRTDGSRATAIREEERPEHVVLLGDSFTFGWAVSDEDTYAWQLHERFSKAEFSNHGAPGYGTYQSLLVLENLLSTPAAPPKLVIYGFADWQAARNVGLPSWLRILALASRRGPVYVPYCTLGTDGTLRRHPPERYWPWPFGGHSFLVAALEDSYVSYASRLRMADEQPVTEQLLREMNDVAQRHASELVVVLLVPNSQYANYLATHGIRLIDCARELTPALKVAGEGHPNGAMHAFWSRCIGDALVHEGFLDGRGAAH